MEEVFIVSCVNQPFRTWAKVCEDDIAEAFGWIVGVHNYPDQLTGDH